MMMCCYAVEQIHTLSKASWFKILKNPIMIRIETFPRQSSPHLLVRHLDGRENYSIGQSRTSLKHPEKYVCYDHDSCYFPFDCTGTSGELVEIRLYSESSSWENTWYSYTAARALPSQNAYAKSLLQYLLWETQEALLQHHTINFNNDNF